MEVDVRYTHPIVIDRQRVRRGGLAEFVRRAWPILEPYKELRWNWHLDAVCEHVQAVLEGKLRRLLIAVPPGTAKSLITAVFAPAYQWGPAGRPGHKTIAASYSATLSTRDSVRCRRLIESPWYQERWPIFLTTDQNTKTRFENDRTGVRVATSVGGTVTGDRANLLICDDLLDVKRAESAPHRKAAADFFWETLPTRLNDPEHDAMIVIAQRLHVSDTIGEILQKVPDRWEKLILPMRFEPKTRCVTSLGFQDPREKDGEILHPERFPEPVLQELEESMGTYACAAQLQQRPSPRGGGMVKDEWLARRFRVRGENPEQIIQSWDAASKAKDSNDPTCGLTFAVFADRVELWDRWYGRKEFPDKLRGIQDFHAAHKGVNAVLIEDKDAGISLIQQLRRDTRLPIVAINPGSLDKQSRMMAETPFIEAGKLWLPDEAEWVLDYLAELTTFPKAAHDDQVDATSQFLKWLRLQQAQGDQNATPISITRENPNIG